MRDILFAMVVTGVLCFSLILCVGFWNLGYHHACLYVPVAVNAICDVCAANWIYEG